MSTAMTEDDINPSFSSAAKNPETTEPTHTFQEGMGSHPLWPMYLEELEASRQADIAEANRQADLELKLDK